MFIFIFLFVEWSKMTNIFYIVVATCKNPADNFLVGSCCLKFFCGFSELRVVTYKVPCQVGGLCQFASFLYF